MSTIVENKACISRLYFSNRLNKNESFVKDYKLVIFDWDGTVMDSIGRIVDSMQAAAKSANLAIPSEEAVKGIIGLSLAKAVGLLFPSITEQQITELAKAYKQHYMEVSTVSTPLFRNAFELLTQLQSAEKTLAVATGKAREGLNRLMAVSNTTEFFSASKTADEAESKPHPDMILKLLAELDIAAEDAVMIGDSIHDLTMANNAGVDAIGVTYGAHDKEDLLALKPVAIVDDMFELEKLLVS